MQNAGIDDRPFTVLRVGNCVYYVAERYDPEYGFIIKRCWVAKVPQRKSHKQFCIISDDNDMYWTTMRNIFLSPDAVRAEAKKQADRYDKTWRHLGKRCRRYFNEECQKVAFAKVPINFDDEEEEQPEIPQSDNQYIQEERGSYVQMRLDDFQSGGADET